MGWNFRRRIKIAPGIHLNFGKRGVSTTIGPRGASMSFGPNGTYINNSIPGTGLYRRTKISSNNTGMSNTSENSGCWTAIKYIVSFILWFFVFSLVIAAFSTNETLGFIFMLIVVVSHLMIHYAGKKNATQPIHNIEKPTTSVQNSKSTTDTLSPVVFYGAQSSAESLYDICVKASKVPQIKDYVDTYGISFCMDGNSNLDAAAKLRMLFWLDAIRCYDRLGHPIDFSTQEGFGLFYLIALSMGNKVKDYDNVSLFRAMYQSSTQKIAESIKPYLAMVKVPDGEFFVADILSHCDTDLRQSYLVEMYRWASVVAKADHNVSADEAAWLANILGLQGDSPSESTPRKRSTTRPRTSRVSAQKELQNLIGLESVKEEVESLSNFIKIQQARQDKGLKTSSASYHCVFTGNPGTGKTTVARILAKIYKQLGVVSKGHLVETDRAGLVAEYVGQTAVKTNKIVDSALDGVLFIDEAYSLISNSENDYGKEAIATLLKRMEDDRDRLVVILAGYTKEMKDFIDSNPGLQSRFNRYIEFSDYNAQDLLKIFEKLLKQYEYTITDDAKVALLSYLEQEVAQKDQNFGNGRFVRNVFEKVIAKQANRLAKEVNLTTEELSKITIEDLSL